MRGPALWLSIAVVAVTWATPERPAEALGKPKKKKPMTTEPATPAAPAGPAAKPPEPAPAAAPATPPATPTKESSATEVAKAVDSPAAYVLGRLYPEAQSDRPIVLKPDMLTSRVGMLAFPKTFGDQATQVAVGADYAFSFVDHLQMSVDVMFTPDSGSTFYAALGFLTYAFGDSLAVRASGGMQQNGVDAMGNATYAPYLGLGPTLRYKLSDAVAVGMFGKDGVDSFTGYDFFAIVVADQNQFMQLQLAPAVLLQLGPSFLLKVGGGGGVTHLSAGTVSNTGYVYGFFAGAMYTLGKKVDLGVSYSLSTYDTMAFGGYQQVITFLNLPGFACPGMGRWWC